MICKDCRAKFDETDQTMSEYEDGQCPACGSEDIVDNEDAPDRDCS